MNPATSKTVIYAALGGNFLIATIKFAAAGITGSAAMLSEAIHSLVDTGNQILLLYGLKRAAKAPSTSHPFGYGLQLYFWTFVVAIMVFAVGAGVSIWEGIEKVYEPHVISNPKVNYIVLGLALIFESFVWLVALNAFRKVKGKTGWLKAVQNSKDPTLFTVLFEDSAAMLGLITALIGIYLSQSLDMPIFDGIASIVIGLILAATSGFLAYESMSLLTGEGVSPAVRDSISKIAEAEPGVGRANEILTMHFGPNEVLCALSLDFDDHRTAADVENAVTQIEKKIKAAHPEIVRIFIEAQSFEAHVKSMPEIEQDLEEDNF